MKTGPGDWRIGGPGSNYTGIVAVNAGRLIVAGVDALGFGGDTPANGDSSSARRASTCRP